MAVMIKCKMCGGDLELVKGAPAGMTAEEKTMVDAMKESQKKTRAFDCDCRAADFGTRIGCDLRLPFGGDKPMFGGLARIIQL